MMKLRQRLRRFRSRSWKGWPAEAYSEVRYQQRLEAVQEHLRKNLNEAPAGPLRLISICAGDGRDVIGVLQTHKRRTDVSAWLVELDRESVAAGVRETSIVGLDDIVRFINGDATDYTTYEGIAPANVVLACGVWGHVPAHERASLAGAIAELCKLRGTITWTRGVSAGMVRLNEIERLFVRPRWENVRTTITADKRWAVATYRNFGPPVALPVAGRIFNFQRHAGR
jgi:putative methyltransferase